jgi:hypothetical protein
MCCSFSGRFEQHPGGPEQRTKQLSDFYRYVRLSSVVAATAQNDGMTALGGLISAWVMVKVFQWNTPARWHYNIALFVFLVLVFYLERQSASSQLVTPEEKNVSPCPTSPSA